MGFILEDKPQLNGEIAPPKTKLFFNDSFVPLNDAETNFWKLIETIKAKGNLCWKNTAVLKPYYRRPPFRSTKCFTLEYIK